MSAIAPTVRRFGAAFATSAIIALNRKLGLGLEAADIAALTTVTVAYLAQSAVRQGKAEK